MRSVNVYLRQRSRRSTFIFRRLLGLFAFLVALVWLTVATSVWHAAYADGVGSVPPSTARSSVAPSTPVPRGNSTGVYLGCQELAPASELQASGR